MLRAGPQGVKASGRRCLWPETLSPGSWSVILSPYEGDSNVEPQGADPSESPGTARGKEMHDKRSGGANGRVTAPPVQTQEGLLGGRAGRAGPWQPRAEACACDRRRRQGASNKTSGERVLRLQPHPPT